MPQRHEDTKKFRRKGEIEKQEQPVLITKRGKPIVRIDPIEEDENGIWDIARKFKKTHGPIKDNFEFPPRDIETGKKR